MPFVLSKYRTTRTYPGPVSDTNNLKQFLMGKTILIRIQLNTLVRIRSFTALMVRLRHLIMELGVVFVVGECFCRSCLIQRIRHCGLVLLPQPQHLDQCQILRKMGDFHLFEVSGLLILGANQHTENVLFRLGL